MHPTQTFSYAQSLEPVKLLAMTNGSDATTPNIVGKTMLQNSCKTVRSFAYSSTREQSNKRSGTRLKTESETFFSRLTRCEARALPEHKTLTPRFTDFFTDFEKKTRLFGSVAQQCWELLCPFASTNQISFGAETSF